MRNVFILLLGIVTMAEARDRAAIADKYKWNLADLYASDAAWAAAKESTAKRLPEMAAYKGRLAESATTLHDALKTMLDIDKEVARLFMYASQLNDQDTRVSASLDMRQAAEELAMSFRAASAFVRPELLAMGRGKVDGFMAEDPRLKTYAHFFDRILRMESHTLTPAEETIVARSGSVASSPGSIYSVFTNADMPYPEIVLSTGEKVRLDASGYARHRASANRQDRDAVFKAFWSRHNDFRRTFGTALYSNVKANIFLRDVRKYDSCLEAALDRDRIPIEVYRQLIADVHSALPTLHRYLQIRRRMLNLDQLRYEDLYVPIGEETDRTYGADEGMQMTIDAFAPLGKDYVDAVRLAYQNRWVDFYPTDGKRSGAYSNGLAYDVHPYQLLNYNDSYYDVSMLAHETGHSIHAYLACKNQPYFYSDPSIFVAEVASTLNENLLLHYMLESTKEDATRLFLLGQFWDNIRGVIFRQTMFAEFELIIHERAEAGETLTGDKLSEIYLSLVRQYYGHDAGVCKVDDLYAVEWAFIPHFYESFYVYQYSTSMVAATALANRIREEAAKQAGPRPVRDAYLKLLASGSSNYPIDLLKNAGIDMTTSAPFRDAMEEIDHVMDEMEKILAKK